MTVDVEGMLCAQALAVVHEALRPLAAGTPLTVRGAAADVLADLLVWAKDRGYRATPRADGAVLLEVGTPA
jgi:TusA-related sulfurtransferase